ncbi:MAG: DUF4886 domain-containing protein [Clostridia bacterium]|nr:DUF4886 domain-containing protein [Clostridia bacterium]
MKVLIIGSNFTSQMIEYLPQLAKAGGKELLLGNLRAENCSIESHYRNYIDENEVYTYETYLPGITEAMRPDGIALHEAVEDDEWDIIIFSQNIALSGIRESYNPYLAELSAYCRLMIPGAETILIEPWAYEPGCDKKAFIKAYNSDSDEMASRISECCASAAVTAEIDRVISLGKVWQAVRDSDPGISLTRDGESADEAGKFLSSCVLHRELFSESADYSGLDLKGISADTAAFLHRLSSHI